MARSFFVSTNGNDTTGTGTEVNPWRTLAKANASTTGFDTIYLRGGTYTTESEIRMSNGAGESRYHRAKTISAFNGEPVVLMPSSGTNILHFDNPGAGESSCRSLIFRDIVFDGSDVTGALVRAVSGTSSSDLSSRPIYVMFDTCEFRNGRTHGCHVEVASHFDWVNCTFHSLGTTTDHHGIYLHTWNCRVEGCDFGSGITGYGVRTQGLSHASTDCHYNFFVGNRFHDMDYRAAWLADGGFDPAQSDYSIRFINNLIYDCASDAITLGRTSGFFVYTWSPYIYHNTIVRNAGWAIDILASGRDARIFSNIFWQNTAGTLRDNGFAPAQASDPLYPNITTDPKFFDEANDDFRIQVNSPAAQSSTELADEVPRDFAGVMRGHRGYVL